MLLVLIAALLLSGCAGVQPAAGATLSSVAIDAERAGARPSGGAAEGGAAHAGPPRRERPSPDTLLTYKVTPQDTLRLHVFAPERRDETATPAIVFFHGGGFVGGSARHFYRQARHFRQLGMVAITVEYRVKKKHGTTPFESVRDGVSAMRWVRAHADELGVDPNRIAASGGSAGGHIAASTALLDGFHEPDADTTISARPNALVLFNPVVDVGPGGNAHDRVGDRYTEFSPLHNVDEDAPPTLFLLGTEDDLIPVSTARRFQALMQEAGARCVVVLYMGQGHGFFNRAEGANYYGQSLAEATAFLRSLGYLGK